jgi:hypothetical protein
VLLELAIIAAQALFDIERHHFIGRSRITALGARLQGGAGIEMDDAIGTETDSVRSEGQMAVITAVEILSDNGGKVILRFTAQSIADIHILSRNAQGHGFFFLSVVCTTQEVPKPISRHPGSCLLSPLACGETDLRMLDPARGRGNPHHARYGQMRG